MSLPVYISKRNRFKKFQKTENQRSSDQKKGLKIEKSKLKQHLIDSMDLGLRIKRSQKKYLRSPPQNHNLWIIMKKVKTRKKTSSSSQMRLN